MPGLGKGVDKVFEVLIAVQLVVELCSSTRSAKRLAAGRWPGERSAGCKTLLSFLALVTAASVLLYVLLYTEMLKPLSAMLRARFCKSNQVNRSCTGSRIIRW